MLEGYLTQLAEYAPCTGTDGRGQPVYGPAVTVDCRKQLKAQNVLTATGQTIKTQHVYYLTCEIHEGDRLDGKIVMGVSVWTGLSGAALGYKAVM